MEEYNKSKDIIDNLNSRLECTECENDDQKIEIKVLKTEIKELKIEIKELKTVNQELKIVNQEQNIKINNLEKENQEQKFDKLQGKIITALQDLNSNDELEINFLQPYKTCIKKLRKNRNNVNHYIDNDDNINIIENKKNYLLLQLMNLSPDNIKIINDRYSYNNNYYTFIEEIINYLSNNINNDLMEISDDDLKEIKYWWKY